MSDPEKLLGVLDRSQQVLRGLGDDFRDDALGLEELIGRLQTGRFHLAVLGQFKRGKSTLLNALLGEEVLPAAVVPLTARPTFIRHGAQRGARVEFEDGREAATVEARNADELRNFLAEFVSETANPDNRHGVTRVEVMHPAALLERGVVLIDTPGIGSTQRHNTATTRAFLPQCDAALFMVSADPPITEVEVEFLEEVESHVPRLFFVLNKMDLLYEDQLVEATKFLRDVLADVGRRDTEIFTVSARDALRARGAADVKGWESSGMDRVRHHLINFLAEEKMAVLHQAIARKADALLADCRLRIGITVNALTMPIEDLEARLQAFDVQIEKAEAQRVTAADLLAGDRKRLRGFIEEEAEHMRKPAFAHFKRIAEEEMATSESVDEEEVLRRVADEIPGYFSSQMQRQMETVDRRVVDRLTPHQERADELIREVQQQAATLFDVPYQAPESDGAFFIEHEPYWQQQELDIGMLADAGFFFEKFLPSSMRRPRVKKRIMRKVDQLTVKNVEKFRWSTLQQVDTTFRRFQSTLDERLRQTISATRGAAEAALKRRDDHEASIASDVEHLRSAQEKLHELQSDLHSIAESVA